MRPAEPFEIRFAAPWGMPYRSMNDRLHWARRAQLDRYWRTHAHLAGLRLAPSNRTRRLGWPAVVTVELSFARNARRDPHNYFATVKPIIDGLTDAGLWPDDTPEHVTTTEPRLVIVARGKPRTITVHIEPRQDAPNPLPADVCEHTAPIGGL